jgi:hypothetical protein
MIMELVPKWHIERLEINGRHNYSIDGLPSFFVGVTSILDVLSKPALPAWAAKCTAEYMDKAIGKILSAGTKEGFYNRELLIKRSKKQHRFEKEEAGRFGSLFHSLANGDIKEVPESHKIVWESYQLWLANNKLKIIQGDTKVVSPPYGYGGAFDCLAEDEQGKLVIVDYKTGKSLYDVHASQVAAYAKAAMETFGLEEMPRGLVVRFDKSKVKAEEKYVLDMNKSFELFESALDIYQLIQLNHFGESHTLKPPKIVTTNLKTPKEKTNATKTERVRARIYR